MSIFINGMQLPKDEVAVIIYSDGDVRTEDWTKYSAIEVPDDVQPVKHGKWMGSVCSACGENTSYYYDCSYCPNCGAAMDGEE